MPALPVSALRSYQRDVCVLDRVLGLAVKESDGGTSEVTVSTSAIAQHDSFHHRLGFHATATDRKTRWPKRRAGFFLCVLVGFDTRDMLESGKSGGKQ